MTEGTQMYMPVAPAGTAYGGNGLGGFGYGSDWWLLLILLFAFGGFGWGGGFGGFGMGGVGAAAADGALLYPWMNQNNQIHDGFRDQMVNTTINGIQNAITSGFGDVQLGIAGINQNICQSTAGITQAVSNGFSQAEISNNSRQIANMQQAFANQTAMNQGFNGVQTSMNQGFNGVQTSMNQGFNAVQGQLAQNGFSTASGLSDVKYTIASEECSTRSASAMNTRDIIDAINTKAQGLQDKLCQLELDNYKGQLAQAQRDNVGLQNQLNMANLQASQVAQTADLRQSNASQLNNLVNELRSCPIPCQPVYGSQPIFTCGQNTGCGCNNF